MKRILPVDATQRTPPPTDADKFLPTKEASASLSNPENQPEVSAGAESTTDEAPVEKVIDNDFSADVDSGTDRTPRVRRLVSHRAPAGLTQRATKEEAWASPIHLGVIEREIIQDEKNRRRRLPPSKRSNTERLTDSSLIREAIRYAKSSGYFGGGRK
jgi:hypothetical protein